MSSTDTFVNKLKELLEDAPFGALYSFKNNYEACEKSGFFPAQTLEEVSDWVLSFHSLEVHTVLVARLTSDDWISKVILFYENIYMTSKEARKSMLEKLGGEAKMLGKIFHVISKWAQYLAGNIQVACSDVLAESDKFTKELSSEIEIAQREFNKAQLNLQAMKDAFKHSMMGFMDSGEAYTAAKDEVQKAERNLDAARQRYDRSQAFAHVAAILRKALAYAESVAKEIALFWRRQFENFCSQNEKMIHSETVMPPPLLEMIVAREDIPFWNQLKQQLYIYNVDMTRISNLYTNPDKSSSVPTTKLQISELSYSMPVPSAVDVDSIMAD